MKVKIIKCLEDNYSYILINERNKDACVVDPGESKPLIEFIDKYQINLKFILNTHHHHDHVGGNKDLKNKYNCKIVGFENDKKRIPEIDILLKDRENWKEGEFNAKVYHTPGHTSGHVCFHFPNEKVLFTGDTLFSLGCGRIFEGTHIQMFNSLDIIKSFPKETKLYCGHEYTLNNYNFCINNNKKNKDLLKRFDEIKIKLKNGLPTIPTTLEEELKCNIFLRAKDIDTFSKLRDLKDNF